MGFYRALIISCRKPWSLTVQYPLYLHANGQKEVLEHPEIYQRFRNKDSFDFADLDENPFYYMSLRVLKFPITETDYECILTNLPENEFSTSEIKDLYAMRWG